MLSKEDVKKLDDKVTLLYPPIYINTCLIHSVIRYEHEAREIDNVYNRIQRLLDEYEKKNSD